MVQNSERRTQPCNGSLDVDGKVDVARTAWARSAHRQGRCICVSALAAARGSQCEYMEADFEQDGLPFLVFHLMQFADATCGLEEGTLLQIGEVLAQIHPRGHMYLALLREAVRCE
jgi:hypothetical protein